MASKPFFVRGVAEVSTTAGTDPYVLGGALPGHARFGELVPDSQVVNYRATDGVNNEFAQGVYSAADNTLSRGAVSFSSAGGSIINWGPGRRIIYLDSGDDPAAYGVRSVAGQIGHVSASAIIDAGLADTGVAPGTYTNPTLAVNAKGQITGAANGGGGGGGGASGDPIADFILANPPPDLSHWTQENISSPASVADSAAGPVITQTAPGSGPSARVLWKSLPAYPQDFTADFVLALDFVGSDPNSPSGVLLGRSSVPNMHCFGVRFASGFPEMGNYEYNSDDGDLTSLSEGDRALCWPNFQRLCFRLQRAGGSDTTYFYHSPDCVNWNRFGQSSYFVYAANRIGFWLDMGAGDGTSTGSPDKISSITLLGYRYTQP